MPVPGGGGPLVVRKLAPKGGATVLMFERGSRGVSRSLLTSLGLSPREAEVLQAMMRGSSTAAIAEQLRVTRRTVYKHAERIYAKLGVHDRVAAVSAAGAALDSGAEPPSTNGQGTSFSELNRAECVEKAPQFAHLHGERAGGGGAAGDARSEPGPGCGAAPVTVKVGKVTRGSAVFTVTSREAFAFTGRARLFTAAKKPKAQSGAKAFSLAKAKSVKLTLKLKPALKRGKRTRLVLRLELAAGATKKTVAVKVTLRAPR